MCHKNGVTARMAFGKQNIVLLVSEHCFKCIPTYFNLLLFVVISCFEAFLFKVNKNNKIVVFKP